MRQLIIARKDLQMSPGKLAGRIFNPHLESKRSASTEHLRCFVFFLIKITVKANYIQQGASKIRTIYSRLIISR